MMAVLELDAAIQSVVAMLANIKELKPEQEECVYVFIEDKDIVYVLPNRFVKRLPYQLAPLMANIILG